MPIYEYLCKNCGHTLDELQSIKEQPLLTCPKCKKDTLVRLLGTGGGLIFKGSGFYLTDYKNKSAGGTKDTKAAPSISGNKTETKPAAKSVSKTSKKESKKN